MKLFCTTLFLSLVAVLSGSAQSTGQVLFDKNDPSRDLVFELRIERPMKERMEKIEEIIQDKYPEVSLKKSKKGNYVYEIKIIDDLVYRFHFDEENSDILLQFDKPVGAYTKVFRRSIKDVFNDKYKGYAEGWHLHSAENRALEPKTSYYIEYHQGYLKVYRAKSQADFDKLFDKYKKDLTNFAPDKSFKYGFNPTFTGEVAYHKSFFSDGEEKTVYHGSIVNGKREGQATKFVIRRPEKKHFNLDKAHPIFETGIFIENATFENDQLAASKPVLAKFSYSNNITYEGYLDEEYFPKGIGRIEIKPTEKNDNHFIIEGDFSYDSDFLGSGDRGSVLGEEVVFHDVKNKVTISGGRLYIKNFFRNNLELYTLDASIYFDNAPDISYRGEIFMSSKENVSTQNCPVPLKELMNSYEFWVTLHEKNAQTGSWKSTGRGFECTSASGCVEITQELLAERYKNEQEKIREHNVATQKRREQAIAQQELSEAERIANEERRRRNLEAFRRESANSLDKEMVAKDAKKRAAIEARQKDTNKKSGFAQAIDELTSKPTITVKNSGNTGCQVRLEITNGRFVGGQTALVYVGAYSSKKVIIASTSGNVSITYTPCQGASISVKKDF